MIAAASSGWAWSQARIVCSDTSSRVKRADLDQVAADRAIGVAVLRRVADPDHGAVVEPHLARALDLEEELGDRIVDPEQLEVAARERAALDLGARVVGQELAVADPAIDRVAGELGVEAAEVDAQQVRGRRMERHRIARAGAPRAVAAPARSSR